VYFALWLLIVLYASARVLQLFPDRLPLLAIVTLHVVPPALFALLHGAMRYGLRSILTFFAICLVVGGATENLGVMTGFPFGHYYFTGVMGPKILFVPVLLALAYVGMGYLSWTLAQLILGGANHTLVGSRIVTLPVAASFLMVAWDLAMDPVWGTALHAWIWRDGGPYFGVPISNFLGWYLNVYLIYQAFAFYLRGRFIRPASLPFSYWFSAILFYAISATGNILLLIPHAAPTVVSDPTGAQWRLADITGTCVLVSIFTMGAFAVFAGIRLLDQKPKRLHPARNCSGML
jgi:uncharacterized membrane protein